MNKVSHSFMYGNQEVTFETGEVARQAEAAVMVSMGKTRVLVAVTAAKDAAPGQDFFPLTVHYQEKYYAAGRIPGGYLKRESRPTEVETLTSRLIDRPIRPLFPDGFVNEVQVVATVVALDNDYSAEVAAMLGTSAALTISGVPFNGPIGAAQVGYWDGGYHLNPTLADLDGSDLILSVAGTENAVLMVESEAFELSEEVMLGAVVYGHEQMQVAIEAVKAFDAKVGKPKWDWQAPEKDISMTEKVKATVEGDVIAAYNIADKTERTAKVSEAKTKLLDALAVSEENSDGYEADLLGKAFKDLQKDIVRGRIIKGEPRIDGRDNQTVRPITVKVGVLPQVHGSALFTRGETQALVVTTLGTEKDVKLVDEVAGTYKDGFMLHYNFPPYSVGETGRMGAPGRREIGHGMLARRGVTAVLPHQDDFAYTIRVVSEITESNGSSSMASVCGSSLSMMDAGVPLVAPVAGIAMGLVKEGDDFAVLTDILGDEDHLGDMDFKVAGSEAGITALQMDIKIEGITKEIMEMALAQAKTARFSILGDMNAVLPEARPDVGETAPRYLIMNVPPKKIGEIIGKGGSTIKSIQEQTHTVVEIADDGVVKIAATSKAESEAARDMIEAVIEEPEVDKEYDGKVIKIVDFGAFVSIMPGKEGLLHISKIAEERVENVADYLTEGQDIRVKLLEIDRQGRLKLSLKDVAEALDD